MGDLLAPSFALDQANRSGERHDLDLTCTGFPQRRRRSVRRRACRIDVVDERHAGRSGPDRAEGRGDVASPLVARELALPGRPANPDEERLDVAIPGAGQLARKPLRGMMATPQVPVRVRRHERKHVSRRSLDALADDCGRPCREPSEAPLLPCRHNLPHGRVVLDRATSAGEGEPPPRTLRAPPYRPCRRCAAALAPRRDDPAQSRCARATDLLTGDGADETALR